MIFLINKHYQTEGGTKAYVTKYSDKNDLTALLHEKLVRGRGQSSSDTSNGSEWSGTGTYQEAEDLMLHGDWESFSYLDKFKVQTDRYFMDMTKPKRQKPHHSVDGFSPNVPLAIKDVPQSMFKASFDMKPHKSMRVYFNRGFSAVTDADDIRLIGAATLSAIEYLESTGIYRFEIWVGVTTAGYQDDQISTFFKLKPFDRPMNLFNMAFYLVNPAYLRRIYFKEAEKNKTWPNLTYGGYGHDPYVQDEREVVERELGKDTIIIGRKSGLSMENDSETNFNNLKKLFNQKGSVL